MQKQNHNKEESKKLPNEGAPPKISKKKCRDGPHCPKRYQGCRYKHDDVPPAQY